MKKGKTAVMVAPEKPFETREFELPEVKPGAILTKSIAAGVCGTDIHIWEGKLKLPFYPAVIGHESIATIIELGEGVTEDSIGNSVRVGDRVQVWYVYGQPCGKCYMCLSGERSQCLRADCAYFKPIDKHPHFVGGYGEYVYVPPQAKFLRIPDSIPTEVVQVFACAGPTVLRSLSNATPTLTGENVAVQGTGPVGLFAVLYVNACSPRKLIAIGAPEGRLKNALRLGADETVTIEGSTMEGRVRKVQELTDGVGPDTVIEATGVPVAVPEGMEMIRPRGKYVVIGQYSDRGTIPIKPHLITFKALQIFGGGSGPILEDCWRYLRFLEMQKDKFEMIKSLTTHKFTIDQATQALQTVKRGEATKAIFTFST